MLNFNIETKNMAKPMCSLWGELDSYIVTGHDDGALCKWDIKVGFLIILSLLITLLYRWQDFNKNISSGELQLVDILKLRTEITL